MLQPILDKVVPLDHMGLLLYYRTGEVRRFDVTEYAEGSWYGELKDRSYFQSVRLLPGGTGIEWPHGQDIAPHELYELGITVPEQAVNFRCSCDLRKTGLREAAGLTGDATS